jgi:hypothetical protein
MANALYPAFKALLLSGGINLSTADIKAVLVDGADYAYNAAHDFLDDVPSGARVGTSANLSGKTSTNGVFNSDPATMSSVSGDVSEIIILYKDTGVAATSPLIAYYDSATGLPVTPSGINITVSPDAGANHWFAL